MINQQHIEALSPQLKLILNDELKSGNIIRETYQGGFSNAPEDHIFVFLEHPFKSAIRENISGIVYREINDPHYWKAEYDDEENHQTLACSY
ncbi:MAG: hypothetical protein J1E40_07810 [Oscillospiraceae bacterium]|nr:hypothetical protein [Oscillospiraceae bacterium]